jgi:ribosomal protein S18 acetylase RimI-like enzyme
VWIHGPVADDLEWDAIADALLERLLADVPRVNGKHQELAGDTRNERLAHLAARHGFVAGKVHHVLSFDASDIALLPGARVPPIEPPQEPAFVDLHERLFPGTYYSGRQLLDQAARGDAVVLGLVDRSGLFGYVAGRIDEGGNGYIDFVGVTQERRREGHGATLVTAISRALALQQDIAKVELTVSSENAGALALYDRLGFRRSSSAVGYRRSG